MRRSAQPRPAPWRVTLVATAMTLLIGGCGLWPIEIGDGGRNAVNFVNGSDDTVQVVYVPQAGREFVLIEYWIGPGGSASTIEALPCTAGTLIARNEAGQEVDRLDEPLCRGETWRIGGEELPSPG